MNKDQIHKEWVKYPTGKIPSGAFCQSCKRFNVRNTTVQLIAVSNGKILLQKRNLNPEKGSWALVAGYVAWNETLEESMIRELKEEMNLKVDNLELLRIYSDPKRDADGRQNIAVVYVGEVTGEIKIDAYELEDARWFEFKKLPKNIAFDHRKMIGDYLEGRSKNG